MLVKALFLMHIKQYNVAIMMPSGHRHFTTRLENGLLLIKKVLNCACLNFYIVYHGSEYINLIDTKDLF